MPTKYIAKDTKSASAALLAAQMHEGKAADHMPQAGVNQQSVALYAARLAFAYRTKEGKDASPEGLCALFLAAGITNASALRQAGEAIVAQDAEGAERAALPTSGKAAIAPAIWADL